MAKFEAARNQLQGEIDRLNRELQQREEVSKKMIATLQTDKETLATDLRREQEKHKLDMAAQEEKIKRLQAEVASLKTDKETLAKKDGERKYDEQRYAEHGGTLSIGDVEQLKDELKKEKAQHEQTKQDLEKAQTKISAMSALLANDEPLGGGAEGSSGNDTAGGAKGEPDLTKETGTVKHLMAVSPWLSLRNPRGRRGFCCRQVISEMHA